jgi:hypothetical protein
MLMIRARRKSANTSHSSCSQGRWRSGSQPGNLTRRQRTQERHGSRLVGRLHEGINIG